MTVIFETSEQEEDPLGLWTFTVSAAETAPGALSFSPSDNPSAPEPAEPVFRVNLPADSAAASDALAAREQYLLSLNAALEDVPARLDGLVARTRQRQGKSVSFDSSVLDQAETGPEGDLLSLLGDLDAEENPQSGEVSFGLPKTASAALEQAKVGFNALIDQINREVLHFAWVETHLSGQLLARTTIGWTGNTQTAFAQGVNDPQVTLHKRNLHIVTQTRTFRLRLFITIASGATKVSALLATPAGAVLALPAVYQYVMQIMAQVRQLQAVQ